MKASQPMVTAQEANHANLRELCERFVLLHQNGNDDPVVWAHTVSLAEIEIAEAERLHIVGSYDRCAA